MIWEQRMDQTKADGYIVNLTRVFVFTLSVALSLGWLVAPEVVNWARNRVAGYMYGAGESVKHPPSTAASATLPTAFEGPSPLQRVAALPQAEGPRRGPLSAEAEVESRVP